MEYHFQMKIKSHSPRFHGRNDLICGINSSIIHQYFISIFCPPDRLISHHPCRIGNEADPQASIRYPRGLANSDLLFECLCFSGRWYSGENKHRRCDDRHRGVRLSKAGAGIVHHPVGDIVLLCVAEF